MTGIERLRELGGHYAGSGDPIVKMVGHELLSIADQIESEHVSRIRVMAVLSDMERHVSGVEGAEDSPVAHWARELRYALKSYTSDAADTQNSSCADAARAADVTSDAPKVTRDHAGDVSMSAYDLLPADDREAIAWVREHGGMDAVRASIEQGIREHGYLCDIASMLGTSIYDSTDNADALLDKLSKRLMPEGMEWPRFEDGEPVDFGDDVAIDDDDARSVSKVVFYGDQWRLYDRYGCEINEDMMGPGERVKRPVLAADGRPLREGETVYEVDEGTKHVVDHIEYEGGGTPNVYFTNGKWAYPALLTHDKPDSYDALWEDIEDCKVGYADFMLRVKALAERWR